ncbi:hypothetical protein [Deinococcus soli (ex Cha et al. 2016)]|uniref:Beta-lactamase superfamily II metal-dependent hydrolase n=2 Tax=Deinococcus soli (ex Cha et al. 2016) TaxID=1309411 RepID=A0AAE3XKF1_9DEIO|nr:hypothetical protein [Deinococcus soli (ex Cha et al. 2016)]MDR6221233.1 beta-lactamase superfamily II metal-dependent hydrolase [Deinococcus soli (ex Cha et al. 2016)]MDR6331141.1 beta-lactamase superfamily II metal-dependent hydrolase [Deinococcus soli (ex Cha et al. 2016)]MDR6754304.1 beta-lactamase superfamily II metal-dependent hydrolase [Deinococcus soli (ex Cha et al. 2016)]GGB79670.1 hypothetical protein GCM10008019_39900 [Deinococcus soli (ex Cha et al. 2016)]
MQYQVTSLNLVVASHADSDHITGPVPAVQQFKPKYFLNNGLAGTTQIWQKLLTAAKQAGTQGLIARSQVINLGSVKLTVLPPPPGMKNQNTNSVWRLVQYGSFRALMTGDSETPETKAWLKQLPRLLSDRSTCTRAFTTAQRTGTGLADWPPCDPRTL